MSRPTRGIRPGVVPEQSDEQLEPTATAEVVVKGRNVEIPDHFRVYVSQKLARLERFDRSIYLFDVELEHEKNRRQRKNCQRVEITARGRGPVVRGEACADSFYAAFESAVEQAGEPAAAQQRPAQGSLRRQDAGVTRRRHRGRSSRRRTRTPASRRPAGRRRRLDDHEPGRIVRTKEHPSTPMSVDDALYEMELVGHDFFLFHDKDTDRPCVVYRRHAYDYGLIRLA